MSINTKTFYGRHKRNNYSPITRNLNFSKFVPNLDISNSGIIFPLNTNLVFSKSIPSLTIEFGSRNISPPRLDLIFSKFASTVSLSSSIVISPPRIDLNFTQNIPGIAVGSGNVSISVPRKDIAFTKSVPGLVLSSGSVTIQPPSRDLITTKSTPGVSSGGELLLTSRTFVNTSGSTQSAGFVTDFFGQAFKQGNIPTGTAPIFKIGGVAQEFSWGLKSYWPADGSLKFASFFLRSDTSIAGSGTLECEIWSGGTSPTTSARTLTEVYAENIAVLGTGAGSNFGLTGSWGAWLENDANNVEQYVTHDGTAGKAWRILTHVADSSGGTAHGQLECYHFAMALTASGGGLGGFRHLARICQPWYNNDTPAKNWRMFNSVSWQHGAGPTTVPLVWPFTAETFTRVSAWDFNTTTANNWFSGSPFGEGNVIPVILSTTGTLPAGLNTTQIYYARIQDSTGPFKLGVSTFGGFFVNTTDAGSGTHTATPLPTCIHFGSIFTATVNAKYNFFQGAGSMSTDHTVRNEFSRNYLQGTKVLPPYNLALAGTINDNGAFNYDWSPISVGPVYTHIETTGETDIIGPINSFCARHFFNQSVNSEKIIRMIALAGAHLGYCFRDGTTRNFPNLSNTSYTGLPAPSSGQRDIWWGSGTGFTEGFTFPQGANTSAAFAFDVQSYDHITEFAYYPYLMYGEPQQLDILQEQALGAMLQLTSLGDESRNPTVPYSAYGVVTNFAPQYRTMAWCSREVALAAGISPDAHPDGSQITQFFRGQDDANMDWLANGSPSLMNSYANTWGLHLVSNGTTAIPDLPYQRHYLLGAVCLSYAHSGNADALTFINRIIAWDNHVITTFGGYNLAAYYGHATPGNFASANTGPIISNDANYSVRVDLDSFVTALSWTTSAFTTTGPYVPAVDDKWMFYDDTAGNSCPAGLLPDTPYYIVNPSGNTFDLSATIGGSVVSPSGSGNNSGFGSGPFLITAIHATTGCVTDIGNHSFISNVWATATWSQALGATGASTVTADQNTRLVAGGIDWTTDSMYAYQSTFA